MTKIAVIFKEESEKSWTVEINDKLVDVLCEEDIPKHLKPNDNESISDKIKTCYSICFNSVVDMILDRNNSVTDDVKLGRMPSIFDPIESPKENNNPPPSISEDEAIEQSRTYAIPVARRYLSMKL